MAGHSKWANIKHRKAAQDAKKGKIFTRLIREITLATRLGGAETASNSRLRAAVHTALSHNMTRDTVDRAIKRGLGDDDSAALEEIRYEGYGPGGVAIMVDCVSDNRNRTVSEVRHAFTKHGGSLGTDGSVAYLFKKQGILSFAGATPEDMLMEAALDAGATDIVRKNDEWEVITLPEELSAVREQLEAKGLNTQQAEVTMTPATEVELSGEQAEKCLKLMDALEELDDVQNVYSNLEIDDATIATMQG